MAVAKEARPQGAAKVAQGGGGIAAVAQGEEEGAGAGGDPSFF
jgi:hypothetical protein